LLSGRTAKTRSQRCCKRRATRTRATSSCAETKQHFQEVPHFLEVRHFLEVSPTGLAYAALRCQASCNCTGLVTAREPQPNDACYQHHEGDKLQDIP
jgi:hypothetical protein